MFRAAFLPETCSVVIPIKLEFSVSVGFIHKESVTMHGHTILKFWEEIVSVILIEKWYEHVADSEWLLRQGSLNLQHFKW